MPDISITIPGFNRAAQFVRTPRSIPREVGAANPAKVDNRSTDTNGNHLQDGDLPFKSGAL
jgi:hypothetical protein